MGLFSSKTKYYVSSSTFPIFDPKKRADQFQAAILDYTANSPIELTEYLRNYYNFSKLRNYRSYLKWCSSNNFSGVFGNTSTDFYSNVSVDTNAVKDAIIGNFQLTPDDEFGVYSASINLFSIDFYIKQLVTEQGKADLLHNASVSYELEYPDDSHVTVKFSNGEAVTGSIPSYKFRDRFLEVAYSITTTKVVIVPPNPPDPSVPPDPTLPEPKPEEQLSITFKYGYIHYKEGTGNAALDTIIKNNNSKRQQSIFPVVPIRAWTAWIGGNQGILIGKALKFLGAAPSKDSPEEAYKRLQDSCIDGMKEGNINDIDYITMVPSVSLATDNPSDARYLYEFFYNLYANEAIANGEPESSVHVAKDLTRNLGFLGKFMSSIGRRAEKAGFTTGYYQKFNLINETSYLNLSYQWAGSAYFEANGQFRPEAKIGEYGVLFGEYSYTYSHYVLEEYAQDNDGNSKYRWVKITEIETFPVTMFCHQYAKSRWHTLMFTDLKLSNHVYHGKYVETFAVDAVKDVASTGSVQHNFTTDKPINSKEVDAPPVVKGIFDRPGPKPDSVFPAFYDFNLKYVKELGESNFALIVPIENETFNEIGYTHQANIAYGSLYLIFNCWVKKKKKWYQNGFFGAIIGVVAVVVACISQQWYIVAAAWSVAIVSFAGLAINMLTRVLTAIFGEAVGGFIGGLLKSIFNYVCAFIVNVVGFWTPIGIGVMIGMTVTNLDSGLQSGMSFSKAFTSSVATSLINYGAAWTAGQFSIANTGFNQGTVNALQLGTYSGLSSFGSSLVDGSSLGEAFKSGVVSGAIAFAMFKGAESLSKILNNSKIMDGFKNQLDQINRISSRPTAQTFPSKTEFFLGNPSKFIQQGITDFITNPNSYVELLGQTQEMVMKHKIANLENDYQEFNNKYKAAMDVLNTYQDMFSTNITLEFLVKMQATLCRGLTNFPDMFMNMDPEEYLTMATVTGSDMLKGSLGSIASFAENKLSSNGYEPYQLYYTQTDYSSAWDVN